MTGQEQALALDIGATKLGVGIVGGRTGRVDRWRTVPTRRDEGPERIVARLFALADEVLDGARVVDVVGISCGGPMDADAGVLLGPLHLPGWDHVELGAQVQQRFGLPWLLLNDASAGAWGEFRFGAARDAGSMVYLTVSSGMGGGAVIGGRLLRGATGNGGEFGHVLVREGGRPCTCGRCGCAETYAAGTKLAERAREALAEGQASSLSSLAEITGEAVSQAAQAGDPLAVRIWDEGVSALASAVTTLVNVLEPEVVVIGGGVANAGDRLFGPVRRTVAREAIRPIRDVVRVVPAALGGPAPAVGAGALALQEASLR